MIANPIMAREVKERMRTLRVPIVLAIYLLILGLIVFAIERGIARSGQYGAFTSALAGRTVFHWLLFFLLMFVCFMVPAFTASTIASERERQTFHLVQVSLMSPSRIVLGKLGAAMLYLGVLILATLPLVSVSFVLGGVTPLDVLRGYGMVMFTGLTIALCGVGVSSRMRRTLGATVLTFLIVGALCVGTLIGYGLVRSAQARQDTFGNFVDRPEPLWTLYLNPFLGTSSAIQGRDTGGSSTPFEVFFGFLNNANQRAPSYTGPRTLVGPGGPLVPISPPPVIPARRVPFWMWTSVLYLVIGWVAFLVAVAGVRAPRAIFRTGRRRRRGAVEG
jgi:ABC-type transport system involved in multi-copper enzyme maturation permease subunit